MFFRTLNRALIDRLRSCRPDRNCRWRRRRGEPSARPWTSGALLPPRPLLGRPQAAVAVLGGGGRLGDVLLGEGILDVLVRSGSGRIDDRLTRDLLRGLTFHVGRSAVGEVVEVDVEDDLAHLGPLEEPPRIDAAEVQIV